MAPAQATSNSKSRSSSNRVRGLDPQDEFIARNYIHANKYLNNSPQQTANKGRDAFDSDDSTTESLVSGGTSRRSSYVASKDRSGLSVTEDVSEDRRHNAFTGSLARLTRKFKSSPSSQFEGQLGSNSSKKSLEVAHHTEQA